MPNALVVAQPMGKNGAATSSQPVMQLMTITPELASEWLTKGGRNRSVSQHHVDRLSRSMKLGYWRVTGDTIKLDSEATVRDGQHRLWAVIESGVSIQSWVTFGIDEGAFDVIDTGRSRHANDVLSIHEFKNSTAVAAAARILIIWEQTGTATNNAHRDKVPTHPEVLQYAVAHKSSLEQWASRSTKLRLAGIPGGAGLWTALLTAFARIDGADAEVFADRVADGANLAAGDGILLLRNRLMEQRGAKARLRTEEIAALIVKAWNAYRERKPVGVLRWTRGGATPEDFPVPR